MIKIDRKRLYVMRHALYNMSSNVVFGFKSRSRFPKIKMSLISFNLAKYFNESGYNTYYMVNECFSYDDYFSGVNLYNFSLDNGNVFIKGYDDMKSIAGETTMLKGLKDISKWEGYNPVGKFTEFVNVNLQC